MFDSGTRSRGLIRWMRCHSSLYLPPTRAQVGPGALAAPLERVVIDELAGHRVVAVAQRLGAERPDHLRVAVVAALADVDVAPGQLQRGVGLEALAPAGWSTSGRTAARSRPGRRPPRRAGSARSSGSCWSRSSRDQPGAWCCAMVFVLRSAAQAWAAASGIGTRARPCRARTVITDVPDHDQHAAQVQQAAEQADHVEREGRLDALDEGVDQRAVGVDRAPHQALHHAGDPHRGDVQHDADGGDPEVQLDRRARCTSACGRTGAGSGSTASPSRSGRPSRARRCARGRRSSRCSGDSALTVLIDIIGPSKVRHAVERQRRRSGTSGSGRHAACARRRDRVMMPLIMPPQLGASSTSEKTMPTVCAQSGSAV